MVIIVAIDDELCIRSKKSQLYDFQVFIVFILWTIVKLMTSISLFVANTIS